MITNRVTQKLISFESKNRDFSEMDEALKQGWAIISIKKIKTSEGKDSFLCKLEKGTTNAQSMSVNQLLAMVVATTKKRKIIQQSEDA